MGTTASLGVAEGSAGCTGCASPRRSKDHRHHRPTSAWNDKNCAATIRSVLQGFNGADRPDNMRPSTCQPSRPTSRDDLSDSALAFTEPKGRFPAVDRGTSITCFVRGGHNSLSRVYGQGSRIESEDAGCNDGNIVGLKFSRMCRLLKTTCDTCFAISLTLK